MPRTELWEAPKGAPVTGHVAFSVYGEEGGAETVTLPYPVLTLLLNQLGLRRKISTHHEVRYSLQPAGRDPKDPPPGYRWVSPRECHGSDVFCPRCAPDSPERRVAPVEPSARH